jgi:Tfp pilus assembly protein PilF
MIALGPSGPSAVRRGLSPVCLAGGCPLVTFIAFASLLLAPLAHTAHTQAPDLAPRTTLEAIAAELQGNDLDAAAHTIQTALQAHPSDPALHNMAGVVAARRGAFDAAASSFSEAIRLAPGDPAAYENLGRLYQERSATDPGARAKALDVYERLLHVDPSNTEALYQSAFLLALEGRFADANGYVTRLPARVHDSPQVLALAAATNAGTGHQAAAVAASEQAAAHPSLTAADVVALAPAFDRLSDAAVWQRLLEALDRRQLATPAALQQLGALYVKQDKPRDAIAVLNRAVERGGVTVPVLLDLARASNKLGDHKGALGYLAHARSLAPDDPAVHFLFGIVCIQLDLGAEAYESLKKAVALAPDSPAVNYAMGAVSLHRHEPAEGVPYFEKYVALAPDDPRGRFALGVARFTSKDFEGARRDLEQVVDRAETSAGAHYFLARIARQGNDLESARRHIDAVLRASPQYPDAWAELGLLQTRAGEYAEAERSLQKALSLDPDNYPATVNLAALYTRTRDPRRDAQTARLAELQRKRGEQAQDFLRTIQVVPQ